MVVTLAWEHQRVQWTLTQAGGDASQQKPKALQQTESLRWGGGESRHPCLEKAPPELERILSDEEEVDGLGQGQST